MGLNQDQNHTGLETLHPEAASEEEAAAPNREILIGGWGGGLVQPGSAQPKGPGPGQGGRARLNSVPLSPLPHHTVVDTDTDNEMAYGAGPGSFFLKPMQHSALAQLRLEGQYYVILVSVPLTMVCCVALVKKLNFSVPL